MNVTEKSPVYLTGLDPVISTRCRVLIVGSFPSSLSLIKHEYYANPRNYFWKIMDYLLHIDSGMPYPDRISGLLSHSIGLWDVVGRCTRTGSADAAIRDPEPTQIGELLIRYPGIRAILCNGRKAEEGLMAALQTHPGQGLVPKVFVRYLPSSSPAHAIRFTEKCGAWMIMCDLLEKDMMEI